ncbi:10382_t:CDS:2 [Paraglomus brasilianum]|uniref:10382_t:CDS:1 n=1 Tax=Paraglomus brasilianum TaxID=144538 RepID=A0A9N9DXN0_9GLOM|nr:10382_t:CDS:2 [Paraglomus brasilianum]
MKECVKIMGTTKWSLYLVLQDSPLYYMPMTDMQTPNMLCSDLDNEGYKELTLSFPILNILNFHSTILDI